MKKNFTLIFAMLLCLFTLGGNAQTQFWSDTFEDVGAPSSGSRTPSIAEFTCGGPPSTAYFMRTLPSGVALQNGTYTGFQGSKIWAVEDIDKGPTCTNNAISANQQVTWSGINITGKSGLSFKGLLAADNIGGWQGLNFGTAQDYAVVEYRIDGGAWTKALAFYSNVPAASPASSNTLDLDTNGDMIGDGAALTYAFTEYSANIVGTGTTLDIRFNCFANAGATQEIAIDNFRLFETPSCTAPVITSNPPNRSICAGGNTTFPVAATGATTYQWQVDTGSGFTNLANGAPYSNVTTNTLTITGATAAMNSYKYRCTAINGVITCFTNTNFGTLNVSNITTTGNQTNITCAGTSTGNASVSPSGGIGSYTYSWSPSGGTGAIATGLSAGNYTVTVTDAIGCTATRNYTITETGTPINTTSSSQTNVACFGGSTGSATISPSGGTSPYTYSWAPSGGTAATASGLSAGTYTVTITDSNGCSKTRNYTITQPAAAVSGTTVVTNVACFGGNTGAINLTPTGGVGPYTFNWGGGITSEDRTGLTAGTYSVTITDANGCTGTVSGITVTQPAAAVSGTTVVTNVTCFGGNTGAINLTPTGGVGPYTFNWVGVATTEDRTGLTAGTYSVTITDANGCTGTLSGITVTQPTAVVSGTTVVTNVACFGGTGAINLTPTGGVGPYTFNWGGGITSEDRTLLTAGSYSVIITDANGCTGTVNATVTQPASALNATAAAQTNLSCNGGANGSATVSASGGTPSYTYSWTPSGGTSATASGLAAGTYTVTVTDANGCTDTQSFTITAPSAIVATPSQTNVTCNGGTDGTASVSVSGGVSGYVYSWSPSGGTSATASGLAAGSYTVTITDANTCTTTQNFTITEPAALDPSVSLAGNILTANQSGATYQWFDCSGGTPIVGATSQSFTPSIPGSYSVTITLNTCSVTSGCTLGNEEFELNNKFVIYPNPNNGILHIKSDFDGDFQIVNQLGQKIKSFKVHMNGLNTIDLDNLSDGIYFVRGENQTKITAQKLIIKK